jgi:hypothetical protein
MGPPTAATSCAYRAARTARSYLQDPGFDRLRRLAPWPQWEWPRSTARGFRTRSGGPLGQKAMQGDTPIQRLEGETGGRMAAIRLAKRPAGLHFLHPLRKRSSRDTGSCADNFRIVYIAERLGRLPPSLGPHVRAVRREVQSQLLDASQCRPARLRRSGRGLLREGQAQALAVLLAVEPAH